MSVIPCHRGGHHCEWPACPLDCDGRHSEPTDLKEARKRKEREAYGQLVLQKFGEMERSNKRKVLDLKAKVQIKAREQL